MKKPRSRGARQNTQVARVSEQAVSAKSAPDLESVLSGVPEEEATDIRIAIAQAHAFVGPLPPPVMFEHYDHVLPGSADRILAMAEKEQSHRVGWERTELRVEARVALLGQILGFLSLASLIGVAAYCATIDQQGVSLACLGAATVGVVSKFISHRWSRSGRQGSQ